jgi:hypothetical protein
MGRNVTITPTAFPIWHTLVANLTLALGWVSDPYKKSITLLGLALGLGEGWWKVSSFLLVLETRSLVRSIAKWLLGRVATTAKHDGIAAAEAV